MSKHKIHRSFGALSSNVDHRVKTVSEVHARIADNDKFIKRTQRNNLAAMQGSTKVYAKGSDIRRRIAMVKELQNIVIN